MSQASAAHAHPEPSASAAASVPRLVPRAWPGWLTAFVLALALYALTANRGIQWQDSGFRVMRVLTHDLVGSLGLALSHPLHYWLGRLVVLPGWANPALPITLLSSLFAAVTVANVFGCVRSLTGRTWAAVFAGASLGLAHIFWQMATLAETYTLVAALLSAEVWCLTAFLRGRRRAMAGMFAFNGLGLANHMLASLTFPVLVVAAALAWRDRRVRTMDLAIAAVAWLAGSLPYSSLVLTEWLRTGDLAGTIRSALFGTAYAGQVLNTRLSAGMLARSAAFLAYDFPNLLLPAAALGLLRAGRLGLPSRLRPMLAAYSVIHALFVIRYNIVDQQTFFVPLCVLLAIWGGLGAARALQWPASTARSVLLAAAVALVVATPFVYAAAPIVARRLGLLEPYPVRPFRDNYVYFFVPWSVVETSADRMAEEAMRLAGPGGTILYEDNMAAPALHYKRLSIGMADVKIESMPTLKTDRGRERFLALVQSSRGPVIFVARDIRKVPTAAATGMSWIPAGNFYVLEIGKNQSPASQPATGG